MLVVGALWIQKASLAGKAAPEVKGLTRLGHFVSDPVFSNEAGMIAGDFQELGVGLAPCLFGELSPEIVNLMASLILASEDTRPTDHADRRSNKGVLKHMAFRGKAVEVRSAADLVSRETKGVVSKVVDEEKENIGPGCRREDGAEQENNQENADPHVISLSPRG